MAPKFRLNPEELHVETFATEGVKEEKGTVFGHWSDQSTCAQIMCDCTYAAGPGMGTGDRSGVRQGGGGEGEGDGVRALVGSIPLRPDHVRLYVRGGTGNGHLRPLVHGSVRA